jgi:hypothetical protein
VTVSRTDVAHRLRELIVARTDGHLALNAPPRPPPPEMLPSFERKP